MAGQSKSLGKKTGSRRPNRRFLIYCEGRVTERIYIDGVKQELRNAGVQVVVGPKHGEPVGLVRAATKHARSFTARDPGRFDEVWCVFFDSVRPGRPAAEARARALDARHGESPLRDRNP